MLFLKFYLLPAALRLCYFARAFSNCGDQKLLFAAVHRLLTAVAFLVLEHRLQALRLSTCSSSAWGIFPDQGSNLCPQHWQVDSYPLLHQGGFPETILILIIISIQSD